MQNFMSCHNLLYFLFGSIRVIIYLFQLVYFVIYMFIGNPLTNIEVLLVVF